MAVKLGEADCVTDCVWLTVPQPPESEGIGASPRLAAIEEGYAATCYVSEHAKEFSVDATRLAVAGDSVGGNMAIVVSFFTFRRLGLVSFSVPPHWMGIPWLVTFCPKSKN